MLLAGVVASRPAVAAPLFSWGGNGLQGAMNTQLKVTTGDASYAFMNGAASNHCMVDSTGAQLAWPYDTTDLEKLYWVPVPGSSLYEHGLWQLNSAVDTATLMVDGFHNIHVADVGDIAASAAKYSCRWASFAALNDHLDANVVGVAVRPSSVIGQGQIADELFTVAALHREANAVKDRWACDYADQIARVRSEAYDHPDIVKAVTLDELGRFLDGPETALYQARTAYGVPFQSYSHWSPGNVEALHRITSGQPMTPATHDVDANGVANASCPTSITPYILSGDIDLWARMLDVLVPRYIVPSLVLGMPGDPDVRSGGSPSGDYSFNQSTGDAAVGTFVLAPPPSSVVAVHPGWAAEVEYLSVVASPFDDVLLTGLEAELKVDVRGTVIPDLTTDLSTRKPDSIAIDSTCIGGPGCPAFAGRPSPWDAYGANTVTFTLAATAETDELDDRLHYIWNVKVRYVDVVTGQVLWDSGPLDPTWTTTGTLGSPGVEVLATDNAAWRVAAHLDGLQIAPEVVSTVHDPVAYDAFMESTCEYLHTAFDDPKRCLLDQRVEGYEAKHYPIDTNAALDRMQAARAWGDGIIGQFMPLNLDSNIGTGGGRYIQRDSLLSGTYDFMVYEPYDTAYTAQSEVHEYSIEIPNQGGACAGSFSDPWTVEWYMNTTANAPRWEMFVDWDDGSVRDSEARLRVANGSPFSTGSVDLSLLMEGDRIFVGWENSGGGGSQLADAGVAFQVTPPAACTTYDPLDADFITRLDDANTDPTTPILEAPQFAAVMADYAAIEPDHDCGGEVQQARACVADYFVHSWYGSTTATPPSCATLLGPHCSNQWP